MVEGTEGGRVRRGGVEEESFFGEGWERGGEDATVVVWEGGREEERDRR